MLQWFLQEISFAVSSQKLMSCNSNNLLKIMQILGTGMSSKKWKTTVEHARSCVLDKTLYLYNPSPSLQKTGVVFNVVGQVTGVLSEGHYVTTDNLSDEEKASFFYSFTIQYL